jgi:hypothetical protein
MGVCGFRKFARKMQEKRVDNVLNSCNFIAENGTRKAAVKLLVI